MEAIFHLESGEIHLTTEEDTDVRDQAIQAIQAIDIN